MAGGLFFCPNQHDYNETAVLFLERPGRREAACGHGANFCYCRWPCLRVSLDTRGRVGG
jgi:hypothetical protein